MAVIDFGRASLRPALSDWLRLEARGFRDDPAREAAFVEVMARTHDRPGAG